jgi:hypothetical protein
MEIFDAPLVTALLAGHIVMSSREQRAISRYGKYVHIQTFFGYDKHEIERDARMMLKQFN